MWCLCSGEYLYWTDWQRRSIERVNKHTGGERTVIIEQLPDLMGLKAVKRVFENSAIDFAGEVMVLTVGHESDYGLR